MVNPLNPHSTQKPLILQLEDESRFLREFLHSDASVRNKCAAFIHFFHRLSLLPGEKRFISFYVEFRHWLENLSHHLPLIGWDPVRTESFIGIVRCFGEVMESKDSECFVEVEKRARLISAAGYLQVGDIASACRLLGWDLPSGTDSLPSEYERAVAILNDGIENARPYAFELKLLLKSWTLRQTRHSPDSLSVLLVDRFPARERDEVEDGVLLDLNATARERPRDAEEDRLLLNNNARPGSDSIYWVLADAIHAARQILVRQSPLVRYYTFEFSLNDKVAAMAGASIALAGAILAYAALMNRHYRAPVVRLSRNAAVTGGIGADGAIAPVDGNGLQAKVTAAFFSPVGRVFLPAANLPAAMHLLEKLQQRYPHRHLMLQGVENLHQAVQDQNLVQLRPLSISLRLMAILRRLRRKKIWASVALLLLFVTFGSQFRWLHWWRDRNPALIDVQGAWVIAKNAAGEILWKFDYGNPLLRGNYVYNDGNVLFTDLDGNGRNELLLGMRESFSSELSGAVVCFSDKGQLLWRYKPGREMTFGVERFTNHYIIIKVQVYSMAGEKRILFNAHHNSFYPCVLTVLTAKGEFLGEYWNSGVLEEMAVFDLDQDGAPEIYAGGCDNETGQAVMVVLDPRDMRGASPQNPSGDYVARGLSPGSQKHYLRFPKSPFHTREIRDTIVKIEQIDQLVKVHLANPLVYNQLRPINQCSMYGWVFDAGMRLTGVEVNDGFRYQVGSLLGRTFTAEDDQALKTIEYWQEGGWVTREQ